MDFLRIVEEFFIETIETLYSTIGWLGVGLLMIVESTVIPLPSEVILTLAGWQLVLERGLGFEGILFGGFVGAVASVLGAQLQYWVARWAGPVAIIKYGKWVLLTREDLDRVERWFDKYGTLTILLLRLVPGLRGAVAIPAGIARVTFWKFSLLVFVAALPWTTFLVWIGYVLGDNYDVIADYLRPFYIPIALVAVALVAWFVFRRLRTIRRESRESQAK